jgi:TonB family protein
MPPRYPAELYKKGVGGTVVLELTIDSCGRVESAQVKQPNRKAFNDAALDSVKGVTLIPELRAKAVEGRVELPITFSINAR